MVDNPMGLPVAASPQSGVTALRGRDITHGSMP